MYYRKSITETCEELNTAQSTGLTQEEAKKRLLSDGPNALVEKKAKTKLQMFLAQLKDTLIYILFAAAAISIALNEITDAIILGPTRYCTGSTPITLMASICSETRIVPN